MLEWVMKMLMACWRPVQRYAHKGTEAADRQDALLWYKDLTPHVSGEFSIAVVQANALLEDQSQVESGKFGTFVGIYDGHGGPEASRFINESLYYNLQKFAEEQQGMSVDVIRKAFMETEEKFFAIVQSSWLTKPQIAAVGSCCLVGVIWGSKLYIASLGDSRAVMGTLSSSSRSSSNTATATTMMGGGPILAVQISAEHNASIESVRQELVALHPDDSHIVVLRHGVWRVKGLIQVSRSIGDVYLKKAEYNREPLLARFRLPEPLRRPVLSAEPDFHVHMLRPQDKFIIFASDGLWEHLSNQEAVDIVHSHPRAGIARRLIRTALQEAAKKREMRYSDLKRIERGIRRHFHDDITVVVVFLDHELLSKGSSSSTSISHYTSVKAGVDN
jgi:pyruvate dehydrogenase phosphatase